MPTSPGEGAFGRFDELAEEFAERYRRGERPGVEEYVHRLPEMADEIRELFPALIEVEQAEKVAREDLHREPPRPSASLPRQIGDYRILREVGRGGMGVVYEAEQVSLGRRVALKVLPGQVSGSRMMVQERFRREARAAARLHHTNIVPVYEVGQDGDTRFYAMQFIQGLGLDQVIAELGQLLDRARAQSRTRGVHGGRSPRSRAGAPLAGVDTPTVGEGIEVGAVLHSIGEGVEVSAVLHSILTGRFDTGTRDPDPGGSLPSMGAGAPVAGLARPTAVVGKGREPGGEPALTRTQGDGAELGETDGPPWTPPGFDFPPSALPSSSPTSNALARGHSALVGRVGSALVLPQPGADRPAGGRGPGLCPRARGHPPRHQAVEPAAGHRGRRLDRRLRAGQGRGRRGADAERRHPGHAPLHGPRAVPGRGRCAGRRLRAGDDAV